ncbi:hypothetical protein TrLO_g7489 [Triparma laevis f. longispina]|uniref:Neutral ceramidase n=1 Tax=Triparma laevis f. longispina TaxID=1714387 RepID=A0A9W7KTY1_9STRA|nr:hypothetical protein TrLO_g7489 [Triparma laevis f. longispina]
MYQFLTLLVVLLAANAHAYKVGVGSADMTGPAAQVNFMGYAVPNQIGRGIHMRLHARAYVVVDDDDSRIAFVSIDGGMGSDLLNLKVLNKLSEALGDDSIYSYDNLAISGTHTHSGPAGFLQYVLYQFTSLGYVEETMDAFVEGISTAILEAHNNVQEGVSISYATGNKLLDSNINRSPSSYLLNPEAERALYEDEGDTDKNMLMLKFTGSDGEDVAMLNWFAVHGTCMNNTNKLISGDNKGLASYLFEREINGADVLPGKGKFVAAFASTNLGDVSPNTQGPICHSGPNEGQPCDFTSSTCKDDKGKDKNEACYSLGPGTNGNMVESTKIIATNQFNHAMEIYKNQAVNKVEGKVGYRHTFLDMRNRDVVLEDGSIGKTCPASLGYSFAAGTTDGPGMFDFTQGTNSSSPFWNVVSGFISKPTEEEIACQSPKPILLNTGDVEKPYEWDPATVPISVFQIGQFFILNVPGELTTMAGRRMRAHITKVLEDGGVVDPVVTIAGLTNTYTHYITTFEEYQAQRYEAASTLYGPHTLGAYMQEMERIVKDLLSGDESSTDSQPEDLTEAQISFVPPVIVDFVGIGSKFGDVKDDVEKSYGADEVVSASFHGANPRNNQRLEDTFLSIEKKGEGGEWVVKYVDGDWCTKFMWEGGVGHAGQSTASVEWDLSEAKEAGLEEGDYRICYFGTRKHATGNFEEFTGCSSEFAVEL